MRKYQKEIFSAVISKRDWMGNNVGIITTDNKTIVTYYWTTIAVVDHKKKTAELSNGGYYNASTTTRINAVKQACDYLGYTY
jgi:hypothetical protein